MSHLSASHSCRNPSALARKSRNHVENLVDSLVQRSSAGWSQEPSLAEGLECCLRDRLDDCR